MGRLPVHPTPHGDIKTTFAQFVRDHSREILLILAGLAILGLGIRLYLLSR